MSYDDSQSPEENLKRVEAERAKKSMGDDSGTAINPKCCNPGCERDADCSYHEKDDTWTRWCTECLGLRFAEAAKWVNARCQECLWFNLPMKMDMGMMSPGPNFSATCMRMGDVRFERCAMQSACPGFVGRELKKAGKEK